MKNKRMDDNMPKKAKVGYMGGGRIMRTGKEGMSRAKVGYKKGGMVGTQIGLKPTNQTTMTVRGGGSAERGLKYKG
tara:strand:+ start:1012 stop:1239 length:228 start_codon:yes stop_codon:yes gene_type:complete